jgi:hypothetical protein
MFQSRFFVCAMLVVLAVISRLLPHPSNVSPLMAIALFSGAHFAHKRDALWVPLLAWFISDLFLGFHALQPVIYGLVLLMAIAGWSLREQNSPIKVLGYSLSGSLVFFLVTNFFVWLTQGMYQFSLAGLIQCYTLAIPFLQNTVAGDVFFNVLLFGTVFELERRKVLVPVKRTV